VITVAALIAAYDVLLSDNARFVERRGLLRRLISDEPLTVVVVSGWPVFWIFLVLVMVALMASTFLIDHHDGRFNPRFYVRLRRIMLSVTSGLIVVGVISAYQQIWSH
jgi:hypothetical protein